MARAKRTERTDARRRHRAEQAVLVESTTGSDTSSGAGPTSGAKSSSDATAKPAQGQRPGFVSLMKAAYRPPHIIDDLKALPEVLLNPGLAIAIVGSIAAAIWFVLAYNTAVSAVPEGDTAGLQAVVESYSLPYTLVNLAIVTPPPAIGAFVIGFMAKRASWLGGLIYGILCTILVVLMLQQPAGRLFTVLAPAESVLIQTAALTPVGAALFAAAAAWYKRFLNLSNPNRGGRQEQQKKQQPDRKPQGRGDVKPNYRSGSR